MILFLSQMTDTPGTGTRGLHVRFLGPTGQSIQCRIERLSDGLVYDFSPGALNFSAGPAQALSPVSEVGMGVYAFDVRPAFTAIFPNGEYCITLHDARAANQAIGLQQLWLGSNPPVPSTQTLPFRWFSF